MRCAACRHENPAGARFCSGCGVGLERICEGCGHASSADAQFCSACGRSMAPGAAAVENREPAPLVGERRQLTVLFCDIVGSTDLAARLDPEEWHAISARYQRCGAEAVERFGGYVAKFLGDGFLTYFGYPLAHDDDAERGTRAGIAVLDALVPLSERLERQHGAPLAVRVGIHTGDVVIGEGGGRDTEVFGEAVHLAARVQQLAGPNEVLITETTLPPRVRALRDGGARAPWPARHPEARRALPGAAAERRARPLAGVRRTRADTVRRA